MNLTSIIIGAFSFVIIGLFHPIVIKCEYHWGSGAWPFFLIAGIAALVAALLTPQILQSCCLSVLGFTCLWSIGELKTQQRRVEKGWFPANPKKKRP